MDVISYTYGQIKIKENEENSYIFFSDLFLLPTFIYHCSDYKAAIWLESGIMLLQIATVKDPLKNTVFLSATRERKHQLLVIYESPVVPQTP